MNINEEIKQSRFHLLIENAIDVTDEITITGMIHGEANIHQLVYLLLPNRSILATIIKDIIVNGERKESVCDEEATIILKDTKGLTNIPRFSCLTSIQPQTTIDPSIPAENPYIRALSYEYKKYLQDQEFFPIFISELVHAHFVTPMFLNGESQSENGKVIIKKDSTMSFPALPDPRDNSKRVFPVFTDWVELTKWTSLFDGKRDTKTLIVNFPDCVAFIENGNSGMVINPFSDTPVLLPDNLFDSIKKSEGYKREFINRDAVQTDMGHMETDAKVFIGTPKKTSEVILMNDAIRKVAKKYEDITAIYMLLKVVEKTSTSYFILFESNIENSANYAREMYEAIRFFGNEIKNYEFANVKELTDADKFISKSIEVYRK